MVYITPVQNLRDRSSVGISIRAWRRQYLLHLIDPWDYSRKRMNRIAIAVIRDAAASCKPHAESKIKAPGGAHSEGGRLTQRSRSAIGARAKSFSNRRSSDARLGVISRPSIVPATSAWEREPILDTEIDDLEAASIGLAGGHIMWRGLYSHRKHDSRRQEGADPQAWRAAGVQPFFEQFEEDLFPDSLTQCPYPSTGYTCLYQGSCI